MGKRHLQKDCNGGPCLLRRPKVLDKTGLGTSRLYELMAEGSFPKPVRLGPRSVAWPAEEVDAWIESRIKNSRRQQRIAAQRERANEEARA